MKKYLTLAAIFASLAIGAWAGHRLSSGPKVKAIQVPYIVERSPIKDTEEIAIEPCVPVEIVRPKGSTRGDTIEGLKTDPEAFTGHSGDGMFPLNLGDLELGSLPDGADINIQLIDNGSGVGRLSATVSPKPPKKIKWLGDLSLGVGVSQNQLGEIGGEIDLRAELFEIKRVRLESELRLELEPSGSDLKVLLKARIPLRKGYGDAH